MSQPTTPRDVIANGIRIANTMNAGIASDIVMSYLASAGLTIVPTALVSHACSLLADISCCESPEDISTRECEDVAADLGECINSPEPKP